MFIFNNDFYGGAVGNRDAVCKPGTTQTTFNDVSGFVSTRYPDYDLNRSCDDIFIPENFGYDVVREASYDMHFDIDIKRFVMTFLNCFFHPSLFIFPVSFFIASGVNLGFLTLNNLQLVQANAGVEFAATHCNAYAEACSGFNISSYQTYYEPIYYPGMSLVYWYVIFERLLLPAVNNYAEIRTYELKK